MDSSFEGWVLVWTPTWKNADPELKHSQRVAWVVISLRGVGGGDQHPGYAATQLPLTRADGAACKEGGVAKQAPPQPHTHTSTTSHLAG